MPRIHTSDLEDHIPDLIRSRIPKARIRTVFDVGANVGWVTISYLNTYPEARLWAFEPVPSIFGQLKENVERHADSSRATFVQKAMGATARQARITNAPDVTVNHLVPDGTDGSIPIEVIRGDDFSRSQGIDHIDLLKIDAEGHDMQALLGFSGMLAEGRIDFVQVEAGISQSNLLHIPLRSFEGLLTALDYRILFIKNQASNEVPILDWADVVFIRQAAADEYA